MSWFDIIKIKTKPVDRDRPAPNIKLNPDGTADGYYDYRTDLVNITPNRNLTPEAIANILVHETTHQAQYNTEPELVETSKKTTATFIKFVSQINDIEIELLRHEDFIAVWREMQPEMERNLKMYFEMLLTIEIQAYSTSDDLDNRQFRIKLVNTMIKDIIKRTKGIKGVLGMNDERYSYVETILVEFLQPLVDRIATSFVRREKVKQ
jgi:hypothetical protein